MRALVISRNLVGDTMYVRSPILKWMSQHPDVPVDLLTMKNFARPLYDGMGIPFANIFESDEELAKGPGDYAYVFDLNAGEAGARADKKMSHIAEGYAEMMGVDLDEPFISTPFGRFRAVTTVYEPPKLDTIEPTEGAILFSPYSLCCTSMQRDANGNLLGNPPNVMLPKEKWPPILEFLRTLGPLRLLGAADVVAPPEWRITEDEYLTGLPIPETAIQMKYSKFAIAVSNGMSHLVASQGTPNVILYPMCLGLNFILPWGCNRMVPLYIDPMEIEPAQIVWALKKIVRAMQLS